MKKSRFDEVCAREFVRLGGTAGDAGRVVGMGFGGSGGLPDSLRAEFEAAGFKVVASGSDDCLVASFGEDVRPAA